MVHKTAAPPTHTDKKRRGKSFLMATETTTEIAKSLVALCREGKDEEAMNRYYSPDILSYEANMENAAGEPTVTRGMEAMMVKYKEWYDNMTVNTMDINDPYIHGDQFAVRFVFNLTEKATGKTFPVDEIGVYRVKEGKIVEERFFQQ